MSSLKELYHEIIKTQQDIAMTYGRVVLVENELKKKISEDNKNNEINEKLDDLQQQIKDVVDLLKEKQEQEKLNETTVIKEKTETSDDTNKKPKVVSFNEANENGEISHKISEEINENKQNLQKNSEEIGDKNLHEISEDTVDTSNNK
nr:unknown [Pieris rapae granulovirus]AGS18815.1 ORF55 [Pieris rapae granulovirus]